MRISDWSSDVCSSDLRIRQRTLLRERFSREVTLQPKDITITSSDERFLQKAMDIVESNMGNFEFNVQAFNGEMELGRTQVERKLKALTGQTPVEFIRIMRLKRDAQKIAAKEDAVSQIAYSVGVNNIRSEERRVGHECVST